MLYDHQITILGEIQGGKRYVVAQPRTGKTRPVISFCSESKSGLKNLVLTKKAAISGWISELKAMGVCLDDWVVVNHEKLRTKSWDFSAKWGNLVIDESHCFGTYPKPNLITLPCHGLDVAGARIGISATPCSESYSQLFHQAKALRLDLWGSYKNFYAWFKDYGIPKQIRAHGRMVAVYTDVKDVAWEEFAEFCCIVDRQEVVEDFVEAEDHMVELEAPEILEMCEKLRKDMVLEIDGHFIVADSPMALAQKCSQICSGKVLDDQGGVVTVNDVKARWIQNRFKGVKVAVLTQFKAEVDPLVTCGARVGSVAEFQADLADWVVGNVASLNAGVDLSRAESLVMTGCPWSFTQFTQGRERLLRRDRVSKAPVYFPVIKGGVDAMIYSKVALGKADFHARMYA